VHVIEKGVPLVQVIPFRRAGAVISGEVRAERANEGQEREIIYRNTIAASGWYRKFARAVR
jgi:hypothetical protein